MELLYELLIFSIFWKLINYIKRFSKTSNKKHPIQKSIISNNEISNKIFDDIKSINKEIILQKELQKQLVKKLNQIINILYKISNNGDYKCNENKIQILDVKKETKGTKVKIYKINKFSLNYNSEISNNFQIKNDNIEFIQKQNQISKQNKIIDETEFNYADKIEELKDLKKKLKNNDFKNKKNEILNNIKNKTKTIENIIQTIHETKIKLFKDKNYCKIGLKNIGNTCYMNAVLQILKNIPKLTYSFKSLLSENKDEFLLSYINLTLNLCSSDSSFIDPNEFKEKLQKENKRFIGNNQYDSTIFYIILLQILHKKLNAAKKDEFKKINLKEINMKDINQHFKIMKEFYSSKNKSLIFEYFYGYFANEIKCTSCDNIKRTIQLFNFLDLPLVTKENEYLKTLKDCINNYLSLNDVKGNKNFICPNCKKLCLTTQNILLELPPILIINLKRIGDDEAYLNEIEIPFELEINSLKNFDSSYELVGFIKHIGNEKGGHNYAICKNMFDDKWYSYNDKKVENSKKIPSTEDSFFYCYIKKGDDIQNIKYLKSIVK